MQTNKQKKPVEKEIKAMLQNWSTYMNAPGLRAHYNVYKSVNFVKKFGRRLLPLTFKIFLILKQICYRRNFK